MCNKDGVDIYQGRVPGSKVCLLTSVKFQTLLCNCWVKNVIVLCVCMTLDSFDSRKVKDKGNKGRDESYDGDAIN